MERGKRVEPNNGEEIPLPEFIIQDIQCRLSRREAAQTTVLSKSWCRAWSTRPDINLDLGNIQNGAENPGALIPDPFLEYARRTMQRYDELNLKIKTFRLRMEGVDHDARLFAGELIEKAMKLGAEDMDVGFTPPAGNKYILSFEELGKKFILPHEMLGSENLVRLSMSGCTFDSGADEGINWPNLKFLGVSRAHIEADVLWDIMMRCPSVEKLEMIDCNFKSEYCPFRNANRCLNYDFYGFGARKIVNNSIVLYAFNRLTCLALSHVKITPWFLEDFSLKFPCVKDLSLCYCLGSKMIYIYSPSLESINIDQILLLRARFDVPSLRKFSVSSSHIPVLTFGTVSGEWESHVFAGCIKLFNNSWFHYFKRFLTVMSPSKLHLSLELIPCSQDNLNLGVGVKCYPVLEDLTINVSALGAPSFWDGLFWSCRPKLITTHSSSIPDMRALEIAYKRLITVNDNCYSANKSMSGQSDLEEVNVEVFDETTSEWKHVSWKTLLDASTSTETKQKICFHLRWGK